MFIHTYVFTHTHNISTNTSTGITPPLHPQLQTNPVTSSHTWTGASPASFSLFRCVSGVWTRHSFVSCVPQIRSGDQHCCPQTFLKKRFRIDIYIYKQTDNWFLIHSLPWLYIRVKHILSEHNKLKKYIHVRTSTLSITKAEVKSRQNKNRSKM